MSASFNPWGLGLPVFLGLLGLTIAGGLSLWLGRHGWLLLIPVAGIFIGQWLGNAIAMGKDWD